jgi:isochorismate pyruvate lyase
MDNALRSTLYALRFGVHAAARFKTDAASVRAPERVRAMLEQRRTWAAEEGLDPEVVVQLFTLLVEYFTRSEQGAVDARGTGQEGGDA